MTPTGRRRLALSCSAHLGVPWLDTLPTVSSYMSFLAARVALYLITVQLPVSRTCLTNFRQLLVYVLGRRRSSRTVLVNLLVGVMVMVSAELLPTTSSHIYLVQVVRDTSRFTCEFFER